MSLAGGARTGGRKAQSSHIARVLLVQLRNMGDVLLCTPAIRALKQFAPDTRIDFLTGSAGAEVLRGNPHLREVLVWPPRHRERWLMVRELRRRRYSAVLDFQSHPRTFWIVAATGAPRRIGIRKRGPRNLAYTHLVPRSAVEVYQPIQKLSLLSALDLPITPAAPDMRLEVAVGDAERARAAEIFAFHGLAGGPPVVAVSAVSKLPIKQWGTERWAVVADALAEAGAQVLLTSGPGERSQAEAVARRMRHPAVWDYGSTTVPELAALYERCVLWVGNDGGALHVAVAVGLPTVGIFRWAAREGWVPPDGPISHRVIARRPAGPCDSRCTHCPHLGCLAAITPAEVATEAVAALRTVLRRKVAEPAVPHV